MLKRCSCDCQESVGKLCLRSYHAWPAPSGGRSLLEQVSPRQKKITGIPSILPKNTRLSVWTPTRLVWAFDGARVSVAFGCGIHRLFFGVGHNAQSSVNFRSSLVHMFFSFFLYILGAPLQPGLLFDPRRRSSTCRGNAGRRGQRGTVRTGDLTHPLPKR